jgi:hypothetical protein
MWPSVLTIGLVGTLAYVVAVARRRLREVEAAQIRFARHRAHAVLSAAARGQDA